MINPSRYKIALIGDSLGEGGAERIQARLSLLLSSKRINVHHIIFKNFIDYDYSGHLLNLGLLKNKNNVIFNRFGKLKILKDYLSKNKFDFIIDFRATNSFLQEYIIVNFVYNSPHIRRVGSYKLDYYFPKNKLFAKIIYSNCYGIVSVSHEITEKIKNDYKYKNVVTIYNPIDEVNQKNELNLGYSFIFGIGRINDNIKQFNHLIIAYKNSICRKQNVKLLLAGDGSYKMELEKLVSNENLTNDVLFLGKLEDPSMYFKKALFTALTSKNEGFPNVILESLINSTPVVSYNCHSGPNEIIKNGHNGLLVEDQSIEKFTLAIDKMIIDKVLYANCKENSKLSVECFNSNAILEKWLKFLNID